MGVASIVLGILALLFAMGGFLVSFIPVIGSFPGVILSFGAPVLALMGIVVGGVGMSRAREEGTEAGSATAGLIVSIIAFFPAFLVAITCGVCNTMCASAALTAPHDQSGQQDPWWLYDAGPGASPGLGATPPGTTPPGTTPPAYPPPAYPPPTAIDPQVPPDPTVVAPTQPGEPPPAFPPPPIDDPAAPAP